MSYVDRNNRRDKSLSGIGSAVLVAGVGYALMTGLAIKIVTTPPPDLIVHNYSDAAPPPPRPNPPVARPKTVPTAAVPPQIPPIVSLPDVGPTIIPLPTIDTSSWKLPGDTATATDAVAPASQAIAARPRGNPAEWVTSDDYPAAALRDGQQGRTGFRLQIGSDGRVTDCAVTQSSGSADLDQTACRMLVRRAHFTPARDASGNPAASTYASNVVWKLPNG